MSPRKMIELLSENIQQLSDDLAASQAKVAELQRDADRYRALREHISGDDWASATWTEEGSAALDAWVDARMKP